MNLFDNREIAMVIWALVIFILVLITRDRRESIRRESFLDAFKGSKKGVFEVLFSLVFMIVYTAAIVFVLYQINFWNISLLKITFFWFCFTAVVMCVNVVTSETNQKVFRKIISDSIKITIIVVVHRQLLHLFTCSRIVFSAYYDFYRAL